MSVRKQGYGPHPSCLAERMPLLVISFSPFPVPVRVVGGLDLVQDPDEL